MSLQVEKLEKNMAIRKQKEESLFLDSVKEKLQEK